MGPGIRDAFRKRRTEGEQLGLTMGLAKQITRALIRVLKEAERNPEARKLEPEKILQVARLASLRFWGLYCKANQ
jgi:hypothetical protein